MHQVRRPLVLLPPPTFNSIFTLCVRRYGVVETDLQVYELQDSNPEAYKHFKKAKGKNGRAVARCELVKYTACVENKKDGKTTKDCAVKKHVKCKQVCRYFVPWGRHVPGPGHPACKLKFKVPGDNPLSTTYDKDCYAKWAKCSKEYCKGPYGAMACKESAAAY